MNAVAKKTAAAEPPENGNGGNGDVEAKKVPSKAPGTKPVEPQELPEEDVEGEDGEEEDEGEDHAEAEEEEEEEAEVKWQGYVDKMQGHYRVAE